MKSNIKYLSRAVGSMPEYETRAEVDTVLIHSSVQELWDGLQREGKTLVCVSQKNLEITDEGTYSQLIGGYQRMLAHYRDITPLVLSEFYGY
jgi:hypothetical protein